MREDAAASGNAGAWVCAANDGYCGRGPPPRVGSAVQQLCRGRAAAVYCWNARRKGRLGPRSHSPGQNQQVDEEGCWPRADAVLVGEPGAAPRVALLPVAWFVVPRAPHCGAAGYGRRRSRQDRRRSPWCDIMLCSTTSLPPLPPLLTYLSFSVQGLCKRPRAGRRLRMDETPAAHSASTRWTTMAWAKRRARPSRPPLLKYH